ncbi:MAG: hypothetical protein V4592_18865 [Bacteroidota bacterium]
MKPCLKYILIVFAAFATRVSYAQKLPNVQQRSLRAPANIKIDGKPSEWNNNFEAYNRATNLYYTLCNDDNNLYMVIHASDPDVLSKITNRGVILLIDPSGKKTDKDAVSITYPIFDLRYGNKPYIHFSNAGGLTHTQRAAMEANPDSMLRVANRKLHESEKYIRTTGMADIDTLISVYNDQKIVAREGFEKGMIYTYELAVPLKYLKLSSGNPIKFAYHVVVPGLNIDVDFGMTTTKLPDGQTLVSFAPGIATVGRDHLPIVTSTTDFWGEYTLAKKP